MTGHSNALNCSANSVSEEFIFVNKSHAKVMSLLDISRNLTFKIDAFNYLSHVDVLRLNY